MSKRKSIGCKIHLTPREKEVLQLKMGGFSIKEAALELGISPKTAQQHVQRMLDKTGCCNTTQLAVIAINTGLFDTQINDNILFKKNFEVDEDAGITE